jgi:hypothetical protein
MEYKSILELRVYLLQRAQWRLRRSLRCRPSGHCAQAQVKGFEPSPAPHESPKGRGKRAGQTGPLSRFKNLARRLFAVDQSEFRDALKKHEAERRAKRGR